VPDDRPLRVRVDNICLKCPENKNLCAPFRGFIFADETVMVPVGRPPSRCSRSALGEQLLDVSVAQGEAEIIQGAGALAGTESLQTPRWRKADSNPRSHSYERVYRVLRKGDPGTSGVPY
jgi:hypothetical protein